MVKKISLFNHKGGVSKTTTTFNLGWMLAEQGQRVVMVDADPQCNLTGMVLGYQGPTELEDFYERDAERNLKAGLAPAFESRPAPIEPVECIAVPGRDGLFLLPGHINLSEYEVTLGIAQELSGSIQTLQNLPGSISYLLEKTAERFDATYILIDMNPGLGSINQNLLMTSDYFIVPTSPDYFSVMAIDSLATVLPRWHRWAKKAASLPILREASYPFPRVNPKFLGTVIQKYRPLKGEPATAFQVWIDRIDEMVSDKLVPALGDIDMLLAESMYRTCHMEPNYQLATIPDFNSLIARSQDAQTPVFALTPEQIGQRGQVLTTTMNSRDNFKAIFDTMTDRVSELTNNASCS
jgi:cellulose biosynthesis protein BcsQ